MTENDSRIGKQIEADLKHVDVKQIEFNALIFAVNAFKTLTYECVEVFSLEHEWVERASYTVAKERKLRAFTRLHACVSFLIF